MEDALNQEMNEWAAGEPEEEGPGEQRLPPPVEMQTGGASSSSTPITPLPGVNIELLNAETQAAAEATLGMDVDELIISAALEAQVDLRQAPQGQVSFPPEPPASTLPWPTSLARPPAPPTGTLPSAQRPAAPQQADDHMASPPGGS